MLPGLGELINVPLFDNPPPQFCEVSFPFLKLGNLSGSSQASPWKPLASCKLENNTFVRLHKAGAGQKPAGAKSSSLSTLKLSSWPWRLVLLSQDKMQTESSTRQAALPHASHTLLRQHRGLDSSGKGSTLFCLARSASSKAVRISTFHTAQGPTVSQCQEGTWSFVCTLQALCLELQLSIPSFPLVGCLPMAGLL